MFAFTSMGAKLDHSHHLIGSLLPIEGDASKFAQLYVYDITDEIGSRMHAFIMDGG